MAPGSTTRVSGFRGIKREQTGESSRPRGLPRIVAWRSRRAPYMSRLTTGETRPMTTFDDRKDTFERKFAHDEELRFKATARRNKLLGLWAADKLGKSGAEAEAYAKSVVMADFQEAGDGDVTRKVKSDLEAGGVAITEGEIKSRMVELMEKAIDDVKAGR